MKRDHHDFRLEHVRLEAASWAKEFIRFAFRGNVFDLAVGVILGMVFSNLINSLINDIIMPCVGLILSGVDFGNLALTLHPILHRKGAVQIRYGVFINTFIQFLVVAGVVFLTFKSLVRFRLAEADKTPMQKCGECCMSIPQSAKKCSYCCSSVVSHPKTPSTLEDTHR
jgi:large conductance mechanosensitive channel